MGRKPELVDRLMDFAVTGKKTSSSSSSAAPKKALWAWRAGGMAHDGLGFLQHYFMHIRVDQICIRLRKQAIGVVRIRG